MKDNPEIVQKDHPTLRKKAVLVEEKEFNTEDLKKIIENMQTALSSQEDGVALAAPQINISKRIFVISPKVLGIETHLDPKTPLVYINPEITKISKDKKKVDEGCLSVRPWYGKVRRATRASVKGLLAQIFQHETDHLDGVLFTDMATDLQEIDLDFEK
jgi:peptide deformylase